MSFFLENENRDWNVHGHIVRVNEAAHDESHRGNSNNIPIEEEIIAANEGKTADRLL